VSRSILLDGVSLVALPAHRAQIRAIITAAIGRGNNVMNISRRLPARLAPGILLEHPTPDLPPLGVVAAS
jgi:hypothetical protein